jgi:hypothetical protein
MLAITMNKHPSLRAAATFAFVFAAIVMLFPAAKSQSVSPDWPKLEAETMRHFRALLRIDTSDPPGREAPAVEYLKKILDAEGIE